MKSHFDMKTDTPRMDEAWLRPQRQGKGLVYVLPTKIALSVSDEGKQLERELAAVEAQRDRLAEALERVDYCLSGVEDVIHGDGADGISVARKIIIEALAAVEGGQP